MSEALDRLERVVSARVSISARKLQDPEFFEALCYRMWAKAQIGGLIRAGRLGEVVYRLGGLTEEEVGFDNGVHLTGSLGKSLGEKLFAELDIVVARRFPFLRVAAWLEGLNITSFFLHHRGGKLQISDCFIDDDRVTFQRQWIELMGSPRAIAIDSRAEEVLTSGKLRTSNVDLLQQARRLFANFIPIVDKNQDRTLKNLFKRG